MTEAFERGIPIPEETAALAAESPIRLALHARRLMGEDELPPKREMATMPEHVWLVNPGYQVRVEWNAAFLCRRNIAKENVGSALVFGVCAEVNPDRAPAARIVQQRPLFSIHE
jgi:hypothetical protein